MDDPSGIAIGPLPSDDAKTPIQPGGAGGAFSDQRAKQQADVKSVQGKQLPQANARTTGSAVTLGVGNRNLHDGPPESAKVPKGKIDADTIAGSVKARYRKSA